jgi:hypothetical protein
MSQEPRVNRDWKTFLEGKEASEKAFGSELLGSQSVATRTLTVREAFALAGHPVPDSAKVFYWDGWHATQDDGAWHFALAYIGNPDCGPGWLTAEGSWNYRQIVDVSNLPARDCLEALPSIVQAALSATSSGTQPVEQEEVAECSHQSLTSSPPPSVEEAAREAFEEFAQSEGISTVAYPDGTYESAEARRIWRVWQASRFYDRRASSTALGSGEVVWANEETKAKGWVLDLNFLDSIREKAKERYETFYELEATEAIALAALQLTHPSTQGPKRGEETC